MSPSPIPSLLSESRSGECHKTVFEWKRTRRYVDEQNWFGVSPERVEAGMEIGDGLT